MRRVVITGSAGFIGGALARRLRVRDDVRVIGVDLVPHTGVAECVVAPVESLQWRHLLGAGDIVFHLGAPNDIGWCEAHSDETVHQAVIGAEHILSAAWERKARVVLATTSATLDGRRTRTAYAASKRCCEVLADYWGHKGLEVATVRYWNVYGPGQRPTAVVPRFVRQAVAGESIIVWHDDDRNGRDFVHVNDVNDFHEQLLKNWVPGEHNVGTRAVTSIKNLAEMVATLSGAPAPRVAERPADTPPPTRPFTGYMRPAGWVPRITLIEGLKDLIAAERRVLGANA